ncbi:hypothetical protein MTX26_14670 [Bradyrhizobium sp. ISRA443]|uniref:hypothetical protein n=1 Tax=unclassified Bradyrhizobium TaxID=2631580 RepID=UPI002478DA78|nr:MULTISPECIES: hypothetical protein [unclassified Bradyrhizobium]WGR91659.1 hypothetical protein MTX20_25200 [Bradyrhizobium sp. ISRA435]WGS01979.1 hypothetical protein MTX23_14680 [Bradyrhizobium sp. ISRA436]WGS08864.1 hypothetical protein MTX18_14670 [Bradyrhizobium sp. ISRA437]WGS15753.1 hypothetical protein MTX26_14670 [Bradyrhizobium sp. ISRA443]
MFEILPVPDAPPVSATQIPNNSLGTLASVGYICELFPSLFDLKRFAGLCREHFATNVSGRVARPKVPLPRWDAPLNRSACLVPSRRKVSAIVPIVRAQFNQRESHQQRISTVGARVYDCSLRMRACRSSKQLARGSRITQRVRLIMEAHASDEQLLLLKKLGGLVAIILGCLLTAVGATFESAGTFVIGLLLLVLGAILLTLKIVRRNQDSPLG